MSDYEEDTTPVFNIDEDEGKLSITPIINYPYSYENIVENPIIKPISETDRSNMDLEEMIHKKLVDSKKDKQWVNSVLGNVPSYSDSQFVAKLIKLAEETQDVIKLQDLQISNLRGCIKEIVEIVMDKYGVRKENKIVEVEEKYPEGGSKEYLEKLSKNDNEDIAKIAKIILENYNKDKTSKNDKIRYQNSCMEYYKDEPDKKNKLIASKIVRMEL